MILVPGKAAVFEGHVLDVLASLPAESVQCCVTSPPYWGLRNYGVAETAWPGVEFSPMPGVPPSAAGLIPPWTGCLGLEPEPMAFVAHLVHVFREVRRVLRPDGTLWLNLGDTFCTVPHGPQGANAFDPKDGKGGRKRAGTQANRRPLAGLKHKDLLGIPWRVAFALQADGWWLRMDNVWAKPNPMPESVQDRCTKAHEYVFLLAKSPEYFYDAETIKEPAVYGNHKRTITDNACKVVPPGAPPHRGLRKAAGPEAGRNKRSVWTITPKPYRGTHFATMPPDLARTCILAGSKPGDTVLDPFNGSGTTGVVAVAEGRKYAGVELNPGYVKLTRERFEAPR